MAEKNGMKGDAQMGAELATQAATALQEMRPVPLTGEGSIAGVFSAALPGDWKHYLLDYEKHLANPRRHTGTYVVNTPASLGDLFDAFKGVGEAARVFVWQEGHGLNTRSIAVMNDHGDAPDWSDFAIKMVLEEAAEWGRWTKMFNKAISQVAMAHFLEDEMRHVVMPSHGDLLKLVSEFEATKDAEYSASVRLDNGDIGLTYIEKTNVKVAVPSRIMVRLAPYNNVVIAGANGPEALAYDIECRFRYYVEGKRLNFALVPVQWDDLLGRIHGDVITLIKGAVAVPIIFGRPRSRTAASE